jgi:NAD(P)-dependent dehydrogenase (short-subunit alcohol dehydrogenase family)
MTRWLDGKVAVITGAGRGIGRAEALLFAAQGARVVVNDVGCARDGTGHDASVAASVAAEIVAEGGEAVSSDHDVRSIEGAEGLIAQAVALYGGVDVVVNSAGMLRDASALRTRDEDFAAVMEGLATATWRVCRAAATRMVAQKRGGRIVNTTAVVGFTGNLHQAAYTAANAAVYGLTRTLALELKKHDIRVNALAPVARTRMTDDLPMFGPGGLTDDTYGPQFVAPAALFLASEACGELTGEALSIAGTRLSTWRLHESAGAVGDDPRSPWTVEAILDRWDELSRPVHRRRA